MGDVFEDSVNIQIHYLSAEGSSDGLGPHNLAGWDASRSLGDSRILFLKSNFSSRQETIFVEESGYDVFLNDSDVVWYHQGDAIARTRMYSGPVVSKIRRFAESGGGVLLSGGALAMVAQLGLEREMRPQRHDKDNYDVLAEMIPVEVEHPAFIGLEPDSEGIIRLSRQGCSAIADFDWGGPAEGMILARTPSGPENPIVEYAVGEGRIIVFGGTWPDYADRENPYRDNLFRLTGNLLHYLAKPELWSPVVIRSDYPPVADPRTSGISDQRWRALRMAIKDLTATFEEQYQHGPPYLQKLEQLQSEHDRMSPEADFSDIERRFAELQSEALLANPLINFENLLVVRRSTQQLGLPQNFNGNADIPSRGYENDLATLSLNDLDAGLQTTYRPEGGCFLGDADLHFDANRLLFSMPNEQDLWRIYELDLTTAQAIETGTINEPDVHNYDACYLTDDRIVFTSTAPFIGVPCVGGKSKVANLYLRELNGTIRRLTNDQDHNWNPSLLNDGRILYQRWEYADIAHAFTRLLFHANPDGTGQGEHYGSNSYWPTAMFFPRAVPDHPTRFVAVVGGHHDAPRQGELVLFDTALGRHETKGVVQRIPGWGEPVKPKLQDGLIGSSWPRFLHPYPLSDKYFLTSCKPTRDALWGVYLVDVFDNFVLLYEEPGQAILEPIPLCERDRPFDAPDRIDRHASTATVSLMDVYRGPGMRGVPRDSIRALRLISYEFTFHGLGCEPNRIGFDGPWDVKRIIGTVPVEEDGSANFTIPANTPIAVQPLDAEGKAVALMRSWFTAGPGETLSCVGCHEPQSMTPPVDCVPLALRREPSDVTPWYGPARGFSFVREVQPVLDMYCVECHSADSDTSEASNLVLSNASYERIPSAFHMRFPPAYTALHRFVYAPTLESDAYLLPPYAYHADVSKLVQILRDGHHSVNLSDEAWDRLITWIDLNAPAHGSWEEAAGELTDKVAAVQYGAQRRREMNALYAGFDEDPEAVFNLSPFARAPMSTFDATPPDASRITAPSVVDELNAAVDQQQLATPSNIALPREMIELSPDITMSIVRLPAGRFVMGSNNGYPNEKPERTVEIDHPFWIGVYEVTNAQYQCFSPSHESGLEIGEQYAFGDYERGHWLNHHEQPVVRVSHDQATAFCHWLSEQTGRRFSLPTESQWEYACRAGTNTPLSYGDLDADFSERSNLSDATHYTVDYPHVPTALPPWRPADIRFDDGWRVSAPVGSFAPNAWGLHDMHGNVAEWTRDSYRSRTPLPNYSRMIVRGGSWMDRPIRARSSFRTHYDESQPVHDVGFRVICEVVNPPSFTVIPCSRIDSDSKP